jgi:hypothetical protein
MAKDMAPAGETSAESYGNASEMSKMSKRFSKKKSKRGGKRKHRRGGKR